MLICAFPAVLPFSRPAQDLLSELARDAVGNLVVLADFRAAAAAQGYTELQVEAMLAEYSALSVITLNPSRTGVYFINE